MQLFEPHGWIHWDAVGSSWHTVTGYELGLAQEKAIGVAADEEPSPQGTAGGSAEASGTEPGAAAEAPLPPVPAPQPTSVDPTTWDADHKRDEDRDDTQHALSNTRWDTQHTLDNARWDTRHTLVNARWDTSLALKRAREDAALAADMSLLSAVHGAYVAVAQGSLAELSSAPRT